MARRQGGRTFQRVDQTVPCPDPLNGAEAGRVDAIMRLDGAGTPGRVLLTKRDDLGLLARREMIGRLPWSTRVIGQGRPDGRQGAVPILIEVTAADLILATHVRDRFPLEERQDRLHAAFGLRGGHGKLRLGHTRSSLGVGWLAASARHPVRVRCTLSGCQAHPWKSVRIGSSTAFIDRNASGP